MEVLFINNQKVNFNAIKKKIINKSMCSYATILLSTCWCWLSVLTSKSIALIVSSSLSKETVILEQKYSDCYQISLVDLIFKQQFLECLYSNSV